MTKIYLSGIIFSAVVMLLLIIAIGGAKWLQTFGIVAFFCVAMIVVSIIASLVKI